MGRVSVWENEKVLEMDSGDGCVLSIYERTLKNC